MAKFPVQFSVNFGKKKKVFLHVKLCITTATAQDPLGNVVMDFPKKKKDSCAGATHCLLGS